MRALITNDDGITSSGLRTLATAAVEAGYEVTVAAPSWDSSGASASLTAVEEDGRFLLERTELEGLDAACYAVEAAPAFIARAAVHEAFGPAPDVVLSGINRGLNAGYAVLHSGTVGAATTAATYHRAGVAFSIDGGEDAHWETAAQVVRAVLGWMRDDGRPVLLNVNVPDVAVGDLRGLRPARLASFGAVTATVTEVGRGHVAMEYRSTDRRYEPGTDAALVQDGFATFTALRPTCQASDVLLAGLGEQLSPGGHRVSAGPLTGSGMPRRRDG